MRKGKNMKSETPPEAKRLFRVEDVAEYLGCCRATIYSRVKAGTFPPPMKLGRAIRWRRSDIEDWLDRQPVGLGPPVCPRDTA